MYLESDSASRIFWNRLISNNNEQFTVRRTTLCGEFFKDFTLGDRNSTQLTTDPKSNWKYQVSIIDSIIQVEMLHDSSKEYRLLHTPTVSK